MLKVVLIGLAVMCVAAPAAGEEDLSWAANLEAGGWSYAGYAASGDSVHFWRPVPGFPQREWARFEYKQPQAWGAYSYISSTSLYDVDCIQGRARSLQTTIYSLANLGGTGQVIGSAEWAFAGPGTVLENIIGKVCAAKPTSARAGQSQGASRPRH